MTGTPVEIRRIMGQSIISQANTCLKRVEYMFFDPQPQRGHVNTSMGTGYHAGLAHYYLDRRAEGFFEPSDGQILSYVETAINTFDADVEIDGYTGEPNVTFDWRFQPKTYRAEEITYDRAMAVEALSNLVRRYFVDGHYWQANYDVVAVEQRLQMSFDGMPGWRRGGGIDLVLAEARTGYVLVDQKTSRKKWAKNKGMPTDPQAAWYIKAWQDWSGTREVIFVYDVIGHDGSFERRLAPRTERQVEVTLMRGREIARLIDQGGPFPPNPESFLCSEAYCNFWNVCPYGKVLNFVGEAA